MLKKIDNRYSISKEEIAEFINKKGYNHFIPHIKESIDLFKTYVNNEEIFDQYLAYIKQEIHSSIPQNEIDKCDFCKGIGKDDKDKICIDYIEDAYIDFIAELTLYTTNIRNNIQFFNTMELRELSDEFIKHFSYVDGTIIFKRKEFYNIISTHLLLSIREYYKELNTDIAIKELHKNLEEIENHILIAKNTNRIILDFVKPQVKLLKQQLKYYKNKKENSSKLDDSKPTSIYDIYKNVFCKSMPYDIIVEHFEIFTSKNSKNGEPFLTKKQLDLFIKKAFCGIPNIQKQTFNQAPKGEKFLIQYRFREFYENYWEYFGTGQVQENFIKLLTENFTNWEYENVKNNFKTKPKKTI
ncbi:hypothetical protein [Lacinutrix sp. Bg11-31]|uniref:hypothetical protein n=1 Tax=Lacinutrix sp. Bg11-31 TaxID=2057808 RepID=UPI000C3151D7|nr:hypothetical protein [Lacinutrix sp. Bg11-31]AUC82258.1 hypothetical protein CW733_09000 [Lacinutrix sp. Bg11-31]